jgi:hypothetical protein
MTPTSNPLRQFFRQPAIYIRLPSGGNFWPAGSIEIPQSNEIAVFPMTALDEITYRTPDALFNGQAVVDVIQSCVPSIRNAWMVPGLDLNSILISMRIASYGHDMEIVSTCPGCRTDGSYTIDLRPFLDSIGKADYSQSLRCGDLEVMFCPMSFEQQNQANIAQFEQQRTIQNIPESDLSDDEKIKRMAEVMKSITKLTIKTLSFNVSGIRTPQSVVTEPEYILEFLSQCDANTFNQIRDHAVELRNKSEPQPVSITCDECKTPYQQQINLEMSSFFARAS